MLYLIVDLKSYQGLRCSDQFYIMPVGSLLVLNTVHAQLVRLANHTNRNQSCKVNMFSMFSINVLTKHKSSRSVKHPCQSENLFHLLYQQIIQVCVK